MRSKMNSLSVLALLFTCTAGSAQATPQLAPTETKGAAPVSVQGISAPGALPAGAVTEPAAIINEFAVLDAPSPTTSPTFGGMLGWAGDDLVVTGPERVKDGGSAGQLATFVRDGEGYKPLVEMFAVPGTRAGALFFQKLAASKDWILTNDDVFGKVGSGLVMCIGRDAASASGWVLKARLRQPGRMEAPNFGNTIASDGVFAAVGIVDQVVRGPDQRVAIDHPSVCMFSHGAKGWEAAGVLTRGPDVNSMWFGASLAIDSGTLAVGSPNAIMPSPKQPIQAGGEPMVCIYRFVDGRWTPEADIKPPADCRSPGFGSTIALKGDVLLVRAPDFQGGLARVLVYRRTGSTWAYDGSLFPSEPVVPGLGWGLGLGVGDGFVIVGDPSAMYPVPGQTEPQRGPGAICVFTPQSGGGWKHEWRLVSTVPTATGRFGGSFAINGRTIAAGRMRSESEGVEPGGALLFKLP